MFKKSNLLKELGWNDALIRHFMVEDGEFVNQAKTEPKIGIFETNSFIIDRDALTSGTTVFIKVGLLPLNQNRGKP